MVIICLFLFNGPLTGFNGEDKRFINGIWRRIVPNNAING